jgi:hypothetical protein
MVVPISGVSICILCLWHTIHDVMNLERKVSNVLIRFPTSFFNCHDLFFLLQASCSLCFILFPLFLFFLLLLLHLIVFLFICCIFSSSQAPSAVPPSEEDCRFIIAWSRRAKAVLVLFSCFTYFSDGLIQGHDSCWGNQ